jgi:hypothetical protein
MSKLNIGLWNVQGLNNGKLNDPDFVSYVDSFDVISFVEILKSESPGGLPRVFYTLCSEAIKA